MVAYRRIPNFTSKLQPNHVTGGSFPGKAVDGQLVRSLPVHVHELPESHAAHPYRREQASGGRLPEQLATPLIATDAPHHVHVTHLT